MERRSKDTITLAIAAMVALALGLLVRMLTPPVLNLGRPADEVLAMVAAAAVSSLCWTAAGVLVAAAVARYVLPDHMITSPRTVQVARRLLWVGVALCLLWLAVYTAVAVLQPPTDPWSPSPRTPPRIALQAFGSALGLVEAIGATLAVVGFALTRLSPRPVEHLRRDDPDVDEFDDPVDDPDEFDDDLPDPDEAERGTIAAKR